LWRIKKLIITNAVKTKACHELCCSLNWLFYEGVCNDIREGVAKELEINNKFNV
jgi:hypothetical protein